MKYTWMPFLFLAVLSAQAMGVSTYSITNIGESGNPSMGLAINNHGQVVGGTILADGSERPFLWQKETGLVELGTAPGYESGLATAINDQGQVLINFQSQAGSDSHAFLWSVSDGMSDLGAVTGWSTSAAAINNHGTIVGAGSVDGFSHNIFGFVSDNQNGILPVTIPGVSISRVGSINNLGQMVIVTSDTIGSFFYTPGSDPIAMRTADLIAVGGPMNDAGTVVGSACPIDGSDPHAFSWNAATGLTDLTPTARGWASGINNLGQIVGVEANPDGNWFAFLYQNGITTDLADLLDASGSGWSDLDPTAINDAGEITGRGLFNGQSTAFFLSPSGTSYSATPTPEPATAAPLLLAATSLLFRRRIHH